MATFTVTNTTDDAQTAGSLRNILGQAGDGDTINFADSINNSTITVGAPLAVTQGVTIDGGGDMVISAAGSNTNGAARPAGVFDIQGGSAPIAIQNLTIDGGNAVGNKGAFGSTGTQGGTGQPGGTGGTGGTGGNAAGGIYVRSGTVTVTDINFTNDTATGGQGGFGGTGGTGDNGNGTKGATGAGGNGGNAAGGVYVEPGATVTAARLTYTNVTSSAGSAGPGGTAGGAGTASQFSNDPSVNAAVVCYCTGTRILTKRGEVAVEDLAIGDTVVTASGAHRPIRWIGSRGYIGRFANANPEVLPICVKADALADGIPVRDLWVSPKHALYLDGLLIPAEHLVNGTTITKATHVESVHYWHVELDSHDVLFAEGAPAESFVDDNGRGIFHNAHTFHEIYPDARRVAAVYCAERVEGGLALAAVRRRLDARAGLSLPGAGYFGDLRGYLDGCEGGVVRGWARDMAHPDAAVCLDVLVDGTVVGLVYADKHRPDLEAAGIGDGRYGFRFALPTFLTEDIARGAAHTIEVRRSADGERLVGIVRLPALAKAA